MQDPKLWISITNHLSGMETKEEAYEFSKWLNARDENKELFNLVKDIWERPVDDSVHTPFLKKFTKEKIKSFIIDEALGNFVGFIVGLSVTHLFSHYVMERRGLKNLFGLAGRKKIAVSYVPEWVQWTLSVVVGFIALEFINHLIQTKQHLIAWNYIKKYVKDRKQA